MHNCNFNKVALLADIRRILWRLDTYGKDANKAGHAECKKLLSVLERDLEKHSKELERAIVGLAKKGKFGFCKKC